MEKRGSGAGKRERRKGMERKVGKGVSERGEREEGKWREEGTGGVKGCGDTGNEDVRDEGKRGEGKTEGGKER